MNKFARTPKFLVAAFCAALCMAAQTSLWGDTNFPGNVTITSNLFVNGSLAVTNIGPAQANTSISISGADGDGYGSPGDVLISGGDAGDVETAGGVVITGGRANPEGHGGEVVLQGGHGTVDGSAGNVILKNRSNEYPGQGGDGYVTLQTSDGTTRFWLREDGTLNANNNAIVNLKGLQLGGATVTNWTVVNGTLSVTNIGGSLGVASNLVVKGALSVTNINSTVSIASNLLVNGTLSVNNNVSMSSNLVVNGALNANSIVPNQANQSITISGADSSGVGPSSGGAVVISGGSGDTGASDNGGDVTIRGGIAWGGHGGDILIAGGYQGEQGRGGDVILQGGAGAGHVMLQTSDGTTRFWLQDDGSLNASGNYLVGARIAAQGDLSMGSFTNSP
jgi:hypothetical protein